MRHPALYDVAIVGLGPVGATAAALLGQHGLRVYVCDRSLDVHPYPRALALDHEIMRVFQQLGVAEQIAPYVEAFTPSEYYGVDGQLIRRMTMLDPPYPQGYTPSLVFAQPEVERVLRGRISQLQNIQVQLGYELHALSTTTDDVTLSLVGPARVTTQVRARWVIGCDGATSRVRQQLKIGLEDLGFDEPWLVADVRVHANALAKLPPVSVQYCEPDRPCSFLIGTGNHRRWEISINRGESPEELARPERTWQLLSRWLDPADGELWRSTSYRFHALVAERMRHGRVFLAGDAAHMQPPFLGQGLCQGIRDVANLTWKLRAVVTGELSGSAAEHVLQSYCSERRAHVRQLIEHIQAVGAVICERDREQARVRDARLLAECGGVVKSMPRQDLLPRLQHGLLDVEPSRARGTLFPQPRLALAARARMLMDIQFGYAWRLVLDSKLSAPAITGQLTHIQMGERGVAETDGVVMNWMRQYECHAALLRPDHYVYGVADTQAQLEGLLARWWAALNS